jgi:hypothetical protein
MHAGGSPSSACQGSCARLLSCGENWVGETLVPIEREVVHAHWTYEFAMVALESDKPTGRNRVRRPNDGAAMDADAYRLLRNSHGLERVAPAESVDRRLALRC